MLTFSKSLAGKSDVVPSDVTALASVTEVVSTLPSPTNSSGVAAMMMTSSSATSERITESTAVFGALFTTTTSTRHSSSRSTAGQIGGAAPYRHEEGEGGGAAVLELTIRPWHFQATAPQRDTKRAAASHRPITIYHTAAHCCTTGPFEEAVGLTSATATAGTAGVLLDSSTSPFPLSPVVHPIDLASCNSLTSSPSTFFTRVHSTSPPRSPHTTSSAASSAPTRSRVAPVALPIRFASPTASPPSILSRSSSSANPQGIGAGGSSSRRGSGMAIHFAREEVLGSSSMDSSASPPLQQQRTPQAILSNHPHLSLSSRPTSVSSPLLHDDEEEKVKTEETLLASSNNGSPRSGRPRPPPRLFSPRQWGTFQSQNRGQPVTQVIHHHCHPPPPPSSPPPSPPACEKREAEGFVAPTAVPPQQQQPLVCLKAPSSHSPLAALRRSDSAPLNRDGPQRNERLHRSSSHSARRAERLATAQCYHAVPTVGSGDGVPLHDKLGPAGSAAVMQWFQPEESSCTPLPQWLPSGRVSSSPAPSSPSSPMVPAPPPPPGLDGIMTASWRLPSTLFDSSAPVASLTDTALSVHSNNSSRHHLSSFSGGGGADHTVNNSYRSRHPQPQQHQQASTFDSMSSFLRSGALRPSSLSQEFLTVPNPPPLPPPPPQRETGGRSSLCGSVRSSAHHDQEDSSSCLPPAAGSTAASFFNVVNTRSLSSSMKRVPQQPQTNLTTTAALVAGAPSQSVGPPGGDEGFGPLYDSTIAVTEPLSLLLPERNTAIASPLLCRPPPTTEGSPSPAAKRLRGDSNNTNKDQSSSCSNNPSRQTPNRTASGNWVPLQPVSSSFSSGDASPPRVSPKQLDESLALLQSFCRRPVTPPLIVVPSVSKHPPTAAPSRAEGRSPIAAVTRQTVFAVPPLKGDPTLEAAVGSLPRAPNSENPSLAGPSGLGPRNSLLSSASTELRVNSRCSITCPYVPTEVEEEAAIPSSHSQRTLARMKLHP